MDQDNSIFQHELEDTFDNLLESNSDSMSIIPFESSSTAYNLEYFISPFNDEYFNSSLYTSENLTLSDNSAQSALSLDNFEEITLSSDSLNYSDSSNSTSLQNTIKHKSVFVTSFNKKPKPGKSWVWKYMNKDKLVKKITCLVPVERNRKIEKCGESFALLTSTSTLGAHLRTIHRLSENGSLLPLSGISKQPISKKPIEVAQKDPTQPTLLDTIKNRHYLLKKKID
ncbi:12358_t:CDS:1 [Racocetra fulgida]|uniref:12358_t:CDS:1 n=1 Tax=Racocetra fulgida TaxID=60492 RepID=A0A9N9DEJ7_9GLOM|nr:12358_t:CDS:1 [Racocetra fulgida]